MNRELDCNVYRSKTSSSLARQTAHKVLAARRMIERSMERFDLDPARLIGDSAYGSADMLGWLVWIGAGVTALAVLLVTL